jgi:hypothetical protein
MGVPPVVVLEEAAIGFVPAGKCVIECRDGAPIVSMVAQGNPVVVKFLYNLRGSLVVWRVIVNFTNPVFERLIY